MTTFGNACESRPNTFAPGDGSASVFDATNPITEWGTLTQVCIYVQGDLGGATLKVKIFRPNGTNIDFVAESSSQTAVAGTNTFNGLNIPLQPGDYIGWYQSGFGADVAVTVSGGSVYFLDGDITTQTTLSNWTNYGYVVSILATYTPNLSDVYVTLTGSDSNSGGTLASAKLTLYGGIQVLNNNLHIGFGDFSTQTSFRIARTMNWVFDTSGGVGTTIFPATV